MAAIRKWFAFALCSILLVTTGLLIACESFPKGVRYDTDPVTGEITLRFLAEASPGRFSDPYVQVTGGAIGCQERSSWCWAACAQHVMKYRGINMTQSQIAGLFNNGIPIDRPAQMDEVAAVLNWAGLRSWPVQRPATPQELFSVLESGFKLIVLIDPRATRMVGHFVVIEGIGPRGGIVVSDPLTCTTSEVPMSQVYLSNWIGSVVVG
jgi:hypothetical protein